MTRILFRKCCRKGAKQALQNFCGGKTGLTGNFPLYSTEPHSWITFCMWTFATILLPLLCGRLIKMDMGEGRACRYLSLHCSSLDPVSDCPIMLHVSHVHEIICYLCLGETVLVIQPGTRVWVGMHPHDHHRHSFPLVLYSKKGVAYKYITIHKVPTDR